LQDGFNWNYFVASATALGSSAFPHTNNRLSEFRSSRKTDLVFSLTPNESVTNKMRVVAILNIVLFAVMFSKLTKNQDKIIEQQVLSAAATISKENFTLAKAFDLAPTARTQNEHAAFLEIEMTEEEMKSNDSVAFIIHAIDALVLLSVVIFYLCLTNYDDVVLGEAYDDDV